jgi:hypothetical protein
MRDDEYQASYNVRYYISVIGGDEAIRLADLFMVEPIGANEVLAAGFDFKNGSCLGIKSERTKLTPVTVERPQRHVHTRKREITPTPKRITKTEPVRQMLSGDEAKKLLG